MGLCYCNGAVTVKHDILLKMQYLTCSKLYLLDTRQNISLAINTTILHCNIIKKFISVTSLTLAKINAPELK